MGHGQDRLNERAVEHLTALFGHHGMEARVFGVREPTAVVEAAQHLLFDLAEKRDELRDAGQVVRSRAARQHRGPVFGKRIGLCGSVVIDDLGGHHATEPFPDVPLVEPCRVGDPGAGGWGHPGQRVEQSALVPEGQQDRHAGGVDRPDQP